MLVFAVERRLSCLAEPPTDLWVDGVGPVRRGPSRPSLWLGPSLQPPPGWTVDAWEQFWRAKSGSKSEAIALRLEAIALSLEAITM